MLLLVILACDGRTRERRTARGENFVSDPDHLFFKNTRSRDYRSLVLEEGVDAYYHDELREGEEAIIIDRWIEDRAVLMVNDVRIEVSEARSMRDSLRQFNRSAELEVVEDFLRLVGR